jgi:hypothetical protein
LFSNGGVEGDHTYPSSPRNVKVVAEIPNLFPGHGSAEMTVLRARRRQGLRGRRIHARRRNLGAARAQVMENLWARLANDTDTGNDSFEPVESR